jgi:hypothetical protein
MRPYIQGFARRGMALNPNWFGKECGRLLVIPTLWFSARAKRSLLFLGSAPGLVDILPAAPNATD